MLDSPDTPKHYFQHPKNFQERSNDFLESPEACKRILNFPIFFKWSDGSRIVLNSPNAPKHYWKLSKNCQVSKINLETPETFKYYWNILNIARIL